MITENPLPTEEIYPKQEKRRLHAHNPNNHQKMYVITKNTFQPDESFYQKFKPFDEVRLGGFIVWEKK